MKAANYIGIPFADKGRSRAGADCWGLVRIVYREELVIELPNLESRYLAAVDAPGVSELIAEAPGCWQEIPRGEEREYDVIALKVAGLVSHLGIVVAPGIMLHTEKRLCGSQTEHYNRLIWKRRVAGFYRWVGGATEANQDVAIEAVPVEADLSPTFILRIYPIPVSIKAAVESFPVGITIREALRRWLGRDPDPEELLSLSIDGTPSSIDALPGAGQVAAARLMPAGGHGAGAKQSIRSIMSLMITIGSIYFGGWYAGAKLFGGKIAAMALAAGGSIAGNSALNSLFPVTSSKLASSNRSANQYSITGIGNMENQYGAVPHIYGKMRIFPSLAAQSYIEYLGDNLYFRMLFCCGYKTLAHSEFKIGDTPASNYDIEIEALRGDEVSPEITLYPNTVHTKDYAILLKEDYSEPGSEMVTPDDIREILLDFTFPYGLGTFAASGSSPNTVKIYAQYRPHAGGDWVPGEDTENLAADLYPPSWELEGDAHYDDSGAGEFHLGETGSRGSATSPPIAVNFPSGIQAALDLYSTGSTPRAYKMTVYFYRRQGGISDLVATTNDQGKSHIDHAGEIGSGAWEECPMDATCGSRVEFIRIKIDNDLLYHKSIKVKKDPTCWRWEYLSVTGETTSSIRKTIRFKFPTSGQWDIRFKRYPEESEQSNVYDKVYFTRMLSMNYQFPVKLAGLSLIAVRAKASDQLTGQLEDFSCIASAILPAWNGASWDAPAETASPAWAFCDVLKGMVKRPVTDDRIDLDEMLAWADRCDTAGLEFNGVIDATTTVYEAMRSIANVGMAEPCFPDIKFSVAMDRRCTLGEIEASPIFSSRNSIDVSVQRSFVEPPHAIKAKFVNEDADYAEDTRLVYDDGYDEDNATNIQELELFGVTDPDQVYKICRFRIAEAHCRPDIFTRKIDMESITVGRGDPCRIQDDVTMFGLAAFRIKAMEKIGIEITFTFDDEYTMEAGKSYQFVIRYSSGECLTGVPTTIAGTFKTVTLSGFVGGIIPDPEIGDLVVYGEHGSVMTTCLVKEIRRESDLAATLSLVRYNPDMYNAEEIPEFESGITVPPKSRRNPTAPSILSIRSDETVLMRDSAGALISRILLDVEVPSGGAIAAQYLQLQYRAADSGQRWVTPPPVSADSHELYIAPVKDGVSYDIRICSVSTAGRTSDWTAATHTVVGKSTLPDDVPCLYLEAQTTLAWKYPDPPLDLAGFLVRVSEGTSTAWATAARLTDTPIAETRFSIGSIHGGIKTFLVKAVDVAGNESETAVSLTRDTGDPEEQNVLWAEDKKADGFPGVVTAGSVSGGNLAASTGDLFWLPADSPMWLPATDLIWAANYDAMSYEFGFKPPDEYLPCRVWLDLTVASLRALSYRIINAYFEEQFDGALTDKWDSPTDGTWTIVSGVLEAVHNDAGDWHQYLPCKILRPANGTKAYIGLRLKLEDSSETLIGVKIAGKLFQFQGATHYIDSDATAINPSWPDDTWHIWMFEILADLTINWFVEGVLVDSTAFTSTDRIVRLDIEKRTSPTPAYKGYFDEIYIWDEGSEWRPWLGEIELYDGAELVEFLIQTADGDTQGVISKCEAECDVETIRERLENVSISSSGTRLSLTKSYRAIKTVLATVLDDGGGGMFAKVIDRDAVSGPLMKIYNNSWAAVDGRASIDVEGY